MKSKFVLKEKFDNTRVLHSFAEYGNPSIVFVWPKSHTGNS